MPSVISIITVCFALKKWNTNPGSSNGGDKMRQHQKSVNATPHAALSNVRAAEYHHTALSVTEPPSTHWIPINKSSLHFKQKKIRW